MHDAIEHDFRRAIADNPYPGRGLVVGRNSDGDWALIYWIMGRSAHSRNRQFVAENGVLRTTPIDASKVADPSLIIYEAMLELPGVHLVSNGDQTRTLHDALATGTCFREALSTRSHEPDAPHYTPRISAMLDLRQREPELALAILRANPLDATQTDRTVYYPSLPPPGVGRGLTTYAGDGNPLPAFKGEPLLLPCLGTAQEVLNAYWNALDSSNRIAIAVKIVKPDGHAGELLLRNAYV